MIRLLIIIISSVGLLGCSGFGKNLKSFIAGKSGTAEQVKRKPTSFKKKPYNYSGPKRQYKRATQKSLASGNNLGPKAGSLWVMEGQGAYLFSQNVVRMVGDSMPVRLDGDPREQLETKVGVIKNLLDKIKKRKAALQRRPASAKGRQQSENRAPNAENNNAQNENEAAAGAEASETLKVKTVPTRIIERMVDGNYRIKGSQPFMIGKYEYKVIVTGIVRSEDFNEEGLSATKLLDPKFDIVSSKRLNEAKL